jgi:NDP-sugar pyrophosphorylase family protein
LRQYGGKVRAFILAGGVGSRLAPYTLTIPKPMLPVGNIPILEVVIMQLVTSGFNHITISLGHLPHLVRAHIDNLGIDKSIKIDYVQEIKPLGTAGALSLVNPPISDTNANFDDAILVMNGDLLTDLDYRKLFEFHIDNNADATLASGVRINKIEYGVIEKNIQSDELIKINEKPSMSHEIALGIYVVSSAAWKYLLSEKLDMPDLLNRMVLGKHKVICFESKSYWQDIGNIDEYIKASTDFDSFPGKFIKNV